MITSSLFSDRSFSFSTWSLCCSAPTSASAVCFTRAQHVQHAAACAACSTQHTRYDGHVVCGRLKQKMIKRQSIEPTLSTYWCEHIEVYGGRHELHRHATCDLINQHAPSGPATKTIYVGIMVMVMVMVTHPGGIMSTNWYWSVKGARLFMEWSERGKWSRPPVRLSNW